MGGGTVAPKVLQVSQDRLNGSDRAFDGRYFALVCLFA